MEIPKENLYELIEMPQNLAQMTDEALYQLMKDRSDNFKKAVDHYCFVNAVHMRKRKTVEIEMAAQQNLFWYGGMWIEPMVIIPNRFKKVIDEINKTVEKPSVLDLKK